LAALLVLGVQGHSLAQGLPVSMEAPLISGGLGRASEATSLGGGYASGVSGAAASLPGQLKGGLSSLPGIPAFQGQSNTTGQERPLPPLVETRFQQFVEDSTGRRLSLYGYNLFESSRFPSLTDVPVPANYVVGPGDEVDLRLWGMAELSARLPVDRNGQVVIPRVGPVTVAGVRVDQLEAHLKSQVGKVFTSFELSATIGRLRSVQVFVVGQARRPGAYMVSSLSTLIGVLFESGGPSATGSMRNVTLTRGGKNVATLDLYAFIHRGDTSQDARLLPGDVIVIPPAGPRVALLGETDTPAVYELSGGNETLSQLLSFTSGQGSLVLPTKVQLERVDASRAKGPRLVESAALDAKGLATKLRDGDVLTLLKVSPEFANAVTLRGNVSYPLRHLFTPGMRVSDLIPSSSALVQHDFYLKKNRLVQFDEFRRGARDVNARDVNARDVNARDVNARDVNARDVNPRDVNPRDVNARDVNPRDVNPRDVNPRDVNPRDVNARDVNARDVNARDVNPRDVNPRDVNPRDEINWDYATIERTDPTRLVTSLIPFNLAKAVKSKDPQHDLQLIAGDVVTVYSVAELPPPIESRSRFVRVSGEVKVPGVYQLKGGEAMAELIEMAGGLTKNAYLYGAVFTRESVRAVQQENLSRAVRRMEMDLEAKNSALVQNNSSADRGISEALLMQQASQMQMLRRLEGMKSSGRLSLELNPEKLQLPQMTLEDGDEITIPSIPSFVNVYGAVYAESSLIYRSGNTVRDYLDKAGVTRDADLDEVLILRADGTAEVTPKGLVFKTLIGASVMSKKLFPGDSVLVPELVDKRSSYTAFIQGAKDWTQLIYQMGLGAAAIKTLRQ
jgi:polysaccharide export outer membrane protein